MLTAQNKSTVTNIAQHYVTVLSATVVSILELNEDEITRTGSTCVSCLDLDLTFHLSFWFDFCNVNTSLPYFCF